MTERVAFALLCSALVGCPPADELPDDDDDGFELPAPSTLGGDRPASVFVPDDYDGTVRSPLVVGLGGYDSFGADFDDWFGFSARAEAGDFVFVLPDGTVDEDGSPFWNATDTCCDFYDTGVDDVAYLRALVVEARQRLAVDPLRTLFVGHSNGGFMAYRVACEPDSPVTAILSIAGSSWLDEADCRAEHPVSVIQVHGEDDDVMPIDGDQDAPAAAEVVSRWAARAGCGAGLESAGADLDLVPGGGAETRRQRHPCDDGRPIELWTAEGVDHYPDFDAAFLDAALPPLLAPR